MMKHPGHRSARPTAAATAAAAALILLAACDDSATGPGLDPGDGDEPPVSEAPAVLVGAGDIAGCSSDGDEATAALLDTIPGTVFTLGDNAYSSGTAEQFAECYHPSWGRHRERTRPVPGNHDYGTPGAAPYFDYFGENAGEPGKGYYSYDLGDWHVIALNSEIDIEAGSEQLAWLAADLAANPATCTVAYWHHPRFSSGSHGSDSDLRDLWRMLDEAGVDLALTGHDHDYERFAPQDADGNADPDGIRQFVVGTGGADLRPFDGVEPNSERRIDGTAGVLKLELYEDSYRWTFIATDGTVRDEGEGACG